MKKVTTKPLIGLFLFLLFSSCMAEKNPQQAWWLSLSIAPNKTILKNINISSYNKNWHSAVFLNDKIIKTRVTNTQFTELKNSNFKLSLSRDINGNKVDETIRVGVYLDKNNNKGIFLAVFEKKKLLKVFTDSSNNGFSALIKDNKTVRWYKCMNCGEYELIQWNGKSYIIQ